MPNDEFDSVSEGIPPDGFPTGEPIGALLMPEEEKPPEVLYERDEEPTDSELLLFCSAGFTINPPQLVQRRPSPTLPHLLQ
jgi:hypothetical protein